MLRHHSQSFIHAATASLSLYECELWNHAEDEEVVLQGVSGYGGQCKPLKSLQPSSSWVLKTTPQRGQVFLEAVSSPCPAYASINYPLLFPFGDKIWLPGLALRLFSFKWESLLAATRQVDWASEWIASLLPFHLACFGVRDEGS